MPLISTLARMVLKARATAPEAGPKTGYPATASPAKKQTNNNQKSKMKLTNKIVALTGIVAFAATPLFAGTGKTFKETVVVEEETPWYNLSVSTGWDSLYMYRGANVLRKTTNSVDGDWASYGDSIYWTNTAFTWNLTDSDSLTVAGWLGFGLGASTPYTNSYKEFDLMINYAKTVDAWTFGLGYTFYYIFPVGQEFYANELNTSLAYEIDLGFMTLTPSATYYFNLGPGYNDLVAGYGPEDGHGGVNQCSSFLNFKLAGNIPVYKDIVSLAPWSALGLNFGYNQTLEDVGGANPRLQWFNGFNNWEFGCALPIAFNENITLSGYVAYSYAFENLNGTTLPSTFWGGVNLALAF